MHTYIRKSNCTYFLKLAKTHKNERRHKKKHKKICGIMEANNEFVLMNFRCVRIVVHRLATSQATTLKQTCMCVCVCVSACKCASANYAPVFVSLWVYFYVRLNLLVQQTPPLYEMPARKNYILLVFFKYFFFGFA